MTNVVLIVCDDMGYSDGGCFPLRHRLRSSGSKTRLTS